MFRTRIDCFFYCWCHRRSIRTGAHWLRTSNRSRPRTCSWSSCLHTWISSRRLLSCAGLPCLLSFPPCYASARLSFRTQGGYWQPWSSMRQPHLFSETKHANEPTPRPSKDSQGKVVVTIIESCAAILGLVNEEGLVNTHMEENGVKFENAEKNKFSFTRYFQISRQNISG